ncbi:MAG: hypothetical protein JWO93_2318 [Micrococcaceae bacterium]|nr:hypothetical protein [Micrococcaceae bacterium]
MAFEPESDNNQQRLIDFLDDLDAALRDLLERPPAGMRGEYVADQLETWTHAAGVLEEMRQAIMDTSEEVFERAGLMYGAGRAKFRLWNDARRAFLKLRNVRRASRMCHIGASIVGSIADVLNLGEVLKESMEAIKYVADLALSEGGS